MPSIRFFDASPQIEHHHGAVDDRHVIDRESLAPCRRSKSPAWQLIGRLVALAQQTGWCSTGRVMTSSVICG